MVLTQFTHFYPRLYLDLKISHDLTSFLAAIDSQVRLSLFVVISHRCTMLEFFINPNKKLQGGWLGHLWLIVGLHIITSDVARCLIFSL